jgi:uncharacterized membrane protein
METSVARILRAGVIVAAAIVAVGGIVWLAAHGGDQPHYAVFRGEPSSLTTIAGIFGLALAGDPRGIIQVGLLVLLATPVARVAFMAWAFVREGDRLYAAVAAIVLTILLVSAIGTA